MPSIKVGWFKYSQLSIQTDRAEILNSLKRSSEFWDWRSRLWVLLSVVKKRCSPAMNNLGTTRQAPLFDILIMVAAALPGSSC